MAGSVWPALVAGARAKASEVESKFDWIESDIVPMTGGTRTDATYDLGTSTHRFRDAYLSRQLLLPAGSAGTPSITQYGSTNGFYFPATNQISATVPLLGANGSVSAPSFSWLNSPTSGFYRIGADNIAMAAAGVKVIDISASGEIVKPLQPSFLAIWNATSTSLGPTVITTLTASWSEIFDQNSDFANGVFTAPVTGKYLFSFNNVYNISHGAASHVHNLFTTSRTYGVRADTGIEGSLTSGGDLRNQHTGLTVVAPMTAGDLAYVYIYFTQNTTSSAITLDGFPSNSSENGSATANYTFLSGCLIA